MNATTQSILLLTAHFSSADDKDTRPLTIKEWAQFSFWLKERKLNPEKLLNTKLKDTLDGWNDNKITLARLGKLLDRGPALALALEKWTRAGLWVLTRPDTNYPRKLKTRLGYEAPPVLFGCGNQRLLNEPGIAVVGSRKAGEQDLQRSRLLGARAAASGLSLISGGARGVDESAMLGSLEAEGTAVGILADDLLRGATSAKYRRYLLKDELVLISPFYPEAGFNAGNAMQRNKYIYCLAEAAIAVHSGTKGGTWEGVQENLKQQWVPMYVLPSTDREAGNAALVSKGAQGLNQELATLNLSTLFAANAATGEPAGDLLDSAPTTANPAEATISPPSVMETPPTSYVATPPVPEPAATASPAQPTALASTHTLPGTLYECFLLQLQQLTTTTPLKVEELLLATQLHKSQLNAWLKQAISEGRVQELKRPKRYQWQTLTQTQLF
jgi:predicted Rossmann fold nucleotide-binding protein DprA/Smf involved in DNA uptake